MSPILFSVFVGLITVFIIPMMTILVFADVYRSSTRPERLAIWQVATLLGVSALALWTQFWAEPFGEGLLIAATPLWVFCGLGIALSIGLGLMSWQLTRRQRQLERRFIEAVLRP